MKQGVAHWQGNLRRKKWQARVLDAAMYDIAAIARRGDGDHATIATILRAAFEYTNGLPPLNDAVAARFRAWDARGLSWRSNRKR